jgi:hypothetical protein
MRFDAALGALGAGVALALLVERFTWRWMRQALVVWLPLNIIAFDRNPLYSR